MPDSLDQAHKALATNEDKGAIDGTTHAMTIQSDTAGVVSGSTTSKAQLAGFTNTDATQSNGGGANTDIEAYYAVLAGTLRFPDYSDRDDPDRTQIVNNDILGPFLPAGNWIGSGFDKTHIWYQLDGGSLTIIETNGDIPEDDTLVAAGLPFFYSATLIHPQGAPPFLAAKLLSVNNHAIQLRNPIRQLGELVSAVGEGHRIQDLLITPNAGTLTVDRDSGKAFFFSGFPENDLMSTIESVFAAAPVIAKWGVDPTSGIIVPLIRPPSPNFVVDVYDADGVLTTIPAGRWWQIMTVYQHHDSDSQATGTRFGRQLFRTKQAAISALGKALPIPPAAFKPGGWYIVAFLVVSSDCTDLGDLDQAQFFDVHGAFIGANQDIDLDYMPAKIRIVTTSGRIFNGDNIGADTSGGPILLVVDETCDGFTVYDERSTWNMNNLTVNLSGTVVVLNQRFRKFVAVRVSGITWHGYRYAIIPVL